MMCHVLFLFVLTILLLNMLLPFTDLVIKVNAASITYSEDFEDDTVGSSPSATWYVYYENNNVDNANVTGARGYGSSKSFDIHASGATAKIHCYFNLTSSNELQNLSFYWYPLTGHQYLRLSLYNKTNGVDGLVIDAYLPHDTEGDSTSILNRDQSTYHDTGLDFTVGEWNYFSIKYNSSTGLVQYSNGSATSSWMGVYNSSAAPIDQIDFFVKTSVTCKLSFDNLSINSGGSSSNLPSPPSDVSATNYIVNFTASGSISGFDGNNRLTFPTANTSDTSGDIVWSNATTYGTITITNDGINQINITWTKGTGATNTIVEVDISSHSPWSIGDGMEIYNGTGTSTIFDYNDDGTVVFTEEKTYYFALFSYNASGYSTAVTTSCTTGNISIDIINIHIEDIGSGSNLIPKQNLTVYEAGSTSGGWTFDAGTGNVSITTANGLPLAPGDSSIAFVIKAIVGKGIASGTYYDAGTQSLDCSIEIKHTTPT